MLSTFVGKTGWNLGTKNQLIEKILHISGEPIFCALRRWSLRVARLTNVIKFNYYSRNLIKIKDL